VAVTPFIFHRTARGFHRMRVIPGKTLSRCGSGVRRFDVCTSAS
jgi:hypothetical protein